MPKNYQALVFSLLLTALFSASLLVFFHHYKNYRLAKSNYEKTKVHYTALAAKKIQLEKIKDYASLATKVNNAIQSLNYTPDKWTDYKVDFDKGLSFEELSYTLNQTRHGKEYFFIPIGLEITLPNKTILTQSQNKNIDAHLKLQGRYLVKK